MLLQDMWRACMKDCHSLLDRIRGFFYFCVMIGILLGFCASLIFCAHTAYWFIDHAGYIQHTRTVNITASGAWLTGERKPCVSYPFQGGGIGSSIDCDDYTTFMPKKTMEVIFYGRMSQPDHVKLLWDCRRDSQSFTCWQTGGQ